MRTAAGNPPVCHDEDLIGIGDGRKPVGNDNDRLALYQPGYCLLNNRLVLRVDVGGRLVEITTGAFFNMALAMAIRCRSPPERWAPPPPTTVSYPFSRLRINLSQPAALATVSTSASLALGLPMRIFFAHSFVKQVIVLGDKGHLVVKLRQRDFFQVMSAQGDGTLFHIPEAADQFGNGGFTRAAWSYKGGRCARRYG